MREQVVRQAVGWMRERCTAITDGTGRKGGDVEEGSVRRLAYRLGRIALKNRFHEDGKKSPPGPPQPTTIAAPPLMRRNRN